MATKNFNLDTSSDLGGANASDYIVASQKAIKSYIDSKSGGSGSSLPLFATIISDHVLSGDDATGWALQGSTITNTYSTAVNKIINLYNSSNSVDTTYRNIPCKLSSDGRYIADIAQKDNIYSLFVDTGIADFYILDQTNQEFILPRTKWFLQFTLDTSLVNQTNSEQYDSIYSSNDDKHLISSNKLLYYRVGDTIINESEMDASTILAKTTELQTRYSDLDSRVAYLETLIAKCYTSMD